MPTLINGRALGVEKNGAFTAENTAPIPSGRLWPPAAASWLHMRAAFIADGGDPDHFRPGGPASSARSIAQQEFFWANQPPPAAPVGSSNHGWGIAVDIPFPDAQAWLMRNAERFGWSHDEGARVGEPWHFRCVRVVKVRDALTGYTAAEKRWIREYDQIRRTGHADSRRAHVLRRVMAQQRKRIWGVAQPVAMGGDGHGWTRLRKRRYASLKARTT